MFCSGTEVKAGKTCKAGPKSRTPARHVENMSWGWLQWGHRLALPHPCPPLGILRLLGSSQSFVPSPGSFGTPPSCHPLSVAPAPPSGEPTPGFPSLAPLRLSGMCWDSEELLLHLLPAPCPSPGCLPHPTPHPPAPVPGLVFLLPAKGAARGNDSALVLLGAAAQRGWQLLEVECWRTKRASGWGMVSGFRVLVGSVG